MPTVDRLGKRSKGTAIVTSQSPAVESPQPVWHHLALKASSVPAFTSFALIEERTAPPIRESVAYAGGAD